MDYGSDWFVHLISTSHQLELGILSVNSDILPTGSQPQPQGFYITFVVSDVDAVFEAAKDKGLTVLSEPEDTFYGQPRLVPESPEGSIIDVSVTISGFSPDEMDLTGGLEEILKRQTNSSDVTRLKRKPQFT